ncbi:hypothetical protein Daus18300_000655 [Diaporthe australafricana]|uniref:Beta-glucuronidase C-terminal domain-containing protein n=1 Tax=Diaporthe australafricana TaxID=127596 RepID=A0ABR3Y2I7_9PEZI
MSPSSSPLSVFSLFLVAASLVRGDVFGITLQLPTRVPAWAEPLSPHLASLSIEMDRWTDWAGAEIGQPNEYVNQLLRNLGERTGSMPLLRVGANSQDRATLDLSVPVMNATFPEPTDAVPQPEAESIFIGRDFYALSGNLPAGTSFMWGLNLKSFNKSETAAQAELLAEAFQGARSNLTGNVQLVDVEIGNEPDFYGPNTRVPGPLDSSWTLANYSATWQEYAEVVKGAIRFDEGEAGPKLSPGAFTGFVAPGWSVDGAIMAGILDKADLRSTTAQFGTHLYSGAFSPKLQFAPGELMNKKFVRGNLTTKASEIKAAKAFGVRYSLTEANSFANHGVPGLSNTVESTVWGVDYLLYAATMGIERVHLHHGVGFSYNTFQPVAMSELSGDNTNITAPHILPLYHALLIVNEAIGHGNTSYVAELTASNDTLAAYGIWENNSLRRLVALNSNAYLSNSTASSFNVTLEGQGAKRISWIKRLDAPATTASTGL